MKTAKEYIKEAINLIEEDVLDGILGELGYSKSNNPKEPEYPYEIGGAYLALDSFGDIISVVWRSTKGEKTRYSIGLTAPDTPAGRAYLEAKRKQMQAKFKVDTAYAKHNKADGFAPNHDDGSQDKHVPELHNGKIALDWYRGNTHAYGQNVCGSEETLKAVIAEVGEQAIRDSWG